MPTRIEWRVEKGIVEIDGVEFNRIAQIGYNPETGLDMPDEEVIALFEANEIIGVNVKMKHKWLEAGGLDGRPMNAVITDITDDSIILGDEGIPKGLFHEWYELD